MKMMTVAVYKRRHEAAIDVPGHEYEPQPFVIVRTPDWGTITARYPEPDHFHEEIDLVVLKPARLPKNAGTW